MNRMVKTAMALRDRVKSNHSEVFDSGTVNTQDLYDIADMLVEHSIAISDLITAVNRLEARE